MVSAHPQFGQHPPARRVIVHLSDTHLLAGNRPLGGRYDTAANLTATLAAVERTGVRPDAIVFTGDLTDLGVDASAQVAHALSVHAVESEADFYTAVDDYKVNDPDRDAGAGMLGTVEFNSSTLYRYATVNVDQLEKNLGSGDVTREALSAFARAFVLSMPTGKMNTFGNTTVPAAVIYSVRTDRPINFVEAFEDPIDHSDGFVRTAIDELVGYATSVDATYSPALGYWTAGVGPRSERLDALTPRTSIEAAAEAAVDSAIKNAATGEDK